MRTRRPLPAVLLALLLLVTASALAGSLRRRQAEVSHATPAPQPASPLDRRARLVVMDPMPLGEALDQLSCQFRTPIEVDWDAIEAAGPTLRPDDPLLIELRLRNVTLRQTLAKVLESLYGGDALVVEAAGDVARVVPRDPAWDPNAPPPRPVACLYDVGDLLAIEDFDGRRGAFGPAPTPAGLFLPAAPETPDERLQHMVVDLVAPETWRDAGGTGVLWVMGGKMVVVHTPALQRQVSEHLDQLREFLRAPYEKGVGRVSPKR